MKTTANTEPAPLTSGDMETTNVTISQDEGDMTMIMDVLTSTLYTDKISAQLREYGCNGYDANVEAGNQAKPIKVRLPNRLDQSLSIRDFGFGMTKEQIAKVFCQVGRSTKRNSNEFTGMLGIGSKAGLAYGDQFMVVSYVKGHKVVYNVYRDQGKIKMAQLQEDASTDPDGIEIKIPVRMADMPEFVRKAERVFRYFKVRPDVTGATITWADRSHEFGGKGWRFTGKGESVAIMGNVGYNLDGTAMGLPMDVDPYYRTGILTNEQKFAMLVKAGVELDFTIGELEIAANREGLQYRDTTKKAIIARLQMMIAEVAQVFSQKVTGAKNLWEAKCVYASVFKNNNSYGRLSLEQLVAADITWNGNKINGAAFNVSNAGVGAIAGLTVNRYSLGRRIPMPMNPVYNYYSYPSVSAVTADPNTLLVLNDIDSGKQSPTRIKGYFEKNPTCEEIVVFTFPNDIAKKKFLKEKELQESQLTPYSTLPIYVSPPNPLGTPVSTHRPKHSAKVFVLDEARVSTSYYDVKSDYWKIETVDMKTEGGAYVVLDSFFIRGPTGSAYPSLDPHHFLAQIKAMRKANLITGPVYGIKVAVVNSTTLGPKWVKLKTHVAAEFDKLVKANSIAQELADSNAVLSYQRVIDEKHADKFPAKSLMQVYLSNIAKMNKCLLPEDLRKLINERCAEPWIVTPKNLPPPSIDLANEQKKVYAKYPLLRHVNVYDLRGATPSMITNIADYVSLIESAQP